MLTIEDVAKELNISQITVYRHLKSNKIKGVKIGKNWRISEEEIKRVKQYGI